MNRLGRDISEDKEVNCVNGLTLRNKSIVKHPVVGPAYFQVLSIVRNSLVEIKEVWRQEFYE